LYYGLFAIYFILCCYFIPRIPFIKKSGLGTQTIIILFTLKIMAGILLGWMSERYYSQGNDYWLINAHGWAEYNLLFSDPKKFFTNIFSSYYPHYGSFFGSVGSYWNDLENNIVIKVIALINILSRGNYYINALLLNFIGFFGHVALYRIFINIYPNKKWRVIAGCFLLPSTLYFVSGINKDLFVFTLLSMYCYGMYFSLQNGYTFRRHFIVLFSFIFLLLIRNYVALALIPSTISWILCKKYQWNKLKTFVGTYLLSILFLFMIQLVFPAMDPIEIISQKQKDFFELAPAATQLTTDTLQPNIRSLLQSTPRAVNHAFLRPYVWEYPSKFISILAIELLIYQLLFICFILFRDKNNRTSDPFIPFVIILSITLIILGGFIVPNAGALVRYRSLYLPFIITPIICMISWKRNSNNIL